MAEKKSSSVSIVLGVLVLAGAVAVGVGIKKFRSGGGEVGGKEESGPAVKAVVETEGEAEAVVVEAVEEAVVVAAEVEEDEAVEAEAEEVAVEAEAVEAGESETAKSERPAGGGFGGWREIWADLNLTEEEMGRLRDGFGLAMARWQGMSEDERAFETERRRAMRERWETMSDDERQEASQRMRAQFEDWRQSGAVELPDISLD